MFQSVFGKMGPMRKSVRWTVCPTVGSHPTERIIQSANRIANVDLATGMAVLSDGKGGHQGFMKLQPFAGAKVVDDVTVVHHFMTHINRAAKDFEGAIHYVDRPVYTGTKPSWVGEYNVHQCNSAGSTCAMRTLK